MNRAFRICFIFLLGLCVSCSDSSDNTVNVTPLLANYILSSPDSVPEGIAFDPVDRAFYVSSVQGASITRIDADGTETLFRDADGSASMGGLKVDTKARRLWVCARGTTNPDNRVWVFDLDSGAMTMEFLLGAISANGSCNDLVLDSTGVAYVTDPANPNLYRLDPSTEEGTVLASDPLFMDVTGIGLGLNGIATTPDESALIVAKFTPPSLYKVSLPDGGSITPITLSGDMFPTPDGLVILDGDLYSVSDSIVTRTRFNADYTAGEARNLTVKTGLSTATIAESQVFVVKSEITNFVTNRPLNLPFEIIRVDLDAYEP